ncbi:MAG: DUF2231 domain-containing protein [Balneolaceae bacterium]
MNLLPEWAPNIHPLFVHFPIALIFVAVFFDAVRVFITKLWVERIAVALYTIGTLGLIASFWTGREAAETVQVSVQAQTVITDHENMALVTLLFFLAFLSTRIAAGWLKLNLKTPVQTGLVLLGALGCYFVWHTGDLGARLVFEHGVGVAAMERTDQQEAATDEIDPDDISRPVLSENGSWQWQIGPNATLSLAEDFEWLAGSADMADDSKNGTLDINPEGEATMFVFGNNLVSLSAEAGVNLDEFTGVFRIVYHVDDKNNYGFMEVSNGRMRLGQTVNGNLNIFEEDSFNPERWVDLRTSADNGHFYGYSGDEVIIHGHGDELAPGRTGLYIEGTGSIRLQGMNVQVLR